MTILTPNANDISKVVLISAPSVTHAITFNQYYVPLNFTKNDGGRLTVKIPTNKNIAPPGFYMLFLVDKNGVPSVAPIMKIASDAQLPPVPTTPPCCRPMTMPTSRTRCIYSWTRAATPP